MRVNGPSHFIKKISTYFVIKKNLRVFIRDSKILKKACSGFRSFIITNSVAIHQFL